jgi:hypothetical protein
LATGEKPRETRGEKPHAAGQRSLGLAAYVAAHPPDDLPSHPLVKSIRHPAVREYCIKMMIGISFYFMDLDPEDPDRESAKNREFDREALDSGFSHLMKLIEDLPQDNRESAIVATVMMLRAAFSLASDGGKLVQIALDREGARLKGDQAKQEKSQLTAEVVARHAELLLKRHPRHSSHRVAKEICEAVNQDLKSHGVTLKIDAIRNRVKTYRESAGVFSP